MLNYHYTHNLSDRKIILYSSDGTDGYDERGNNWDNAFNFDDLKELAISLDETYCPEYGYEFDCWFELRGSSGVHCHFKDINKKVTYIGELTTMDSQFTSGFLYLNGYVHFQLGEIINEIDKSSKDGCELVFRNGSFGMALIGNKDTEECNIFSSKLRSTKESSGIGNVGINRGTMRIWNTIFQSTMPYASNSDSEFYNVEFVDSYLCFYYGSGNIDKCSIKDCDYVGRIRRSQYNATVWNTTIRNTITGTLYGNNAEGAYYRLTDCDVDEYDFTGQGNNADSDAYRDHTLNIRVIDEEGNNIEGAEVHIIDNLGEQEQTILTNENGEIEETQLNVYHWHFLQGEPQENRIEYDKNPFTITITKEGYIDEVLQYSILERQNLTISIKESIPPIYVDRFIQGSISQENLFGNNETKNINAEIQTINISGKVYHLNKLNAVIETSEKQGQI